MLEICRFSGEDFSRDMVHQVPAASHITDDETPFWSDELVRLEEISVFVHNLWSQCEKLRSGEISSARLKAKNGCKFVERYCLDTVDEGVQLLACIAFSPTLA